MCKQKIVETFLFSITHSFFPFTQLFILLSNYRRSSFSARNSLLSVLIPMWITGVTQTYSCKYCWIDGSNLSRLACLRQAVSHDSHASAYGKWETVWFGKAITKTHVQTDAFFVNASMFKAILCKWFHSKIHAYSGSPPNVCSCKQTLKLKLKAVLASCRFSSVFSSLHTVLSKAT